MKYLLIAILLFSAYGVGAQCVSTETEGGLPRRWRTTIASLFRFCRPSNIAWFVMAVVVDAIKGMRRAWLSAYFVQEIVKRLKAKFNSSAAVAGIFCIVRVITSPFRTAIGAVFRPLRLAVSSKACWHGIPNCLPVTAAGNNVALNQGVTVVQTDILTRTQADPDSTAGRISPIDCQDKKSPKRLSCQDSDTSSSRGTRGKFGRIRDRIQVRHFSLLERLKCLGSLRLFTPAWRVAFIITLLVGFGAVFTQAQCVDIPEDRCISVRQSTLDRAAQAVSELVEARKVIESFKNERAATEAERLAWNNFKVITESAIAVFQKGVADRDKVIELQQKAIEAMAQLNDKLLQQIGKKPSAWKKFVNALKAVSYILAGAALRGNL